MLYRRLAVGGIGLLPKSIGFTPIRLDSLGFRSDSLQSTPPSRLRLLVVNPFGILFIRFILSKNPGSDLRFQLDLSPIYLD
jgi:hypothetical protein